MNPLPLPIVLLIFMLWSIFSSVTSATYDSIDHNRSIISIAKTLYTSFQHNIYYIFLHLLDIFKPSTPLLVERIFAPYNVQVRSNADKCANNAINELC